MKKFLFALALCVLSSSGLFAETYIAPITTALVNRRIHATVLSLRNTSPSDVRCDAAYVVPNGAKDRILRTTYEIRAGETQVEENTLIEFSAVGTLRFDCSAAIDIAVRLQTSDDGVTFTDGRVVRAVTEEQSITPAAPREVRTTTDIFLMEVSGTPTRVTATAKGMNGAVLGTEVFELLPFGQKLLNLGEVLPRHPEVTLDLRVARDGGAIVVAKLSTDPAVLAVTQRRPKDIRALASVPQETPGSQVASLSALSAKAALLVSSFKAAPYRDPVTGLDYMRDRWYDKNTGTFLTPDPEGYADSSNPYAYCGGDPVNCSDPTGRLGDGGDLREDFRRKEREAEARRYALWCAQNPLDCQKLNVRGSAIGRVLGGITQTTAGTGAVLSTGPLPEPVTKTLGGTAIVRGIDNTITGAVELWTGTSRDTVTGRGFYLALVRAGMDPAKASKITGWTEIGVDVASSLGSGLVPAVNTALRIRPIGGIINIGGTGEATATNLNPLLGRTGGQTRNVPNLVEAYADDIGRYFEPGSAREIISSRLPGHTVNWEGFARGAYTTLQEGGTVNMNLYLTGTATEQTAMRAAAIRAFQNAGFNNVVIEGENVATFLRATR